MIPGDRFNYTQHLTCDGMPDLLLYLQVSFNQSRNLSSIGIVAIDNKYYFFDSNESEDINLYEFALDPSVLESAH